MNHDQLSTIEDVLALMRRRDYICDRKMATALFLALKMEKPLFLEGQAGVGKTEVAKVLAAGLGRRLIRLQCYEGLDVSTALYEWNYSKQLLRIKLDEARLCRDNELTNIFSPDFLIKRPLLEAIQSSSRDEDVVLLIDELDRSDEEFEAFLLEILSDFQVTIPELGTLRAARRPVVILTSNRTREIHDALKRRCIYHWIDYPTFEKEVDILSARIKEVDQHLASQVCRVMQAIRTQDYLKKPGVAETLDWTLALMALSKNSLDDQTVADTVGCIFKYQEDIVRFQAEWPELKETARLVHGMC
ncbi:MAG: MoxR family ATPase [Deltaproteobacteria bacterium]|nr:MoxR family ATPase [Deltaproteobacteria bacterium]